MPRTVTQNPRRTRCGWISAIAVGSVFALSAQASGIDSLQDAQKLHASGQYFKSARYAFAAGEEDPSLQAEAYSWITLGLVDAGLEQLASYFFIRTLQSGHKPAIRRALTRSQEIIGAVGADLVRKYMIRHTALEDFDSANRAAFLYALGRESLLTGSPQQALGYLKAVDAKSPLYAFALQTRAAAQTVSGNREAAIADFKGCAVAATQLEENSKEAGKNGRKPQSRALQDAREAEDLRNRCLAGDARVLYELDKFEDADRAYDKIPKDSIVWTDVLFEQAWNSFGRQEYNRTLGKLVSYKSPALSFVHNSEVDVLRAQAYLALCLYDDANGVINEFHSKHTGLGEKIKGFVEANSKDLAKFFNQGREALTSSLHTKDSFYRVLNRFVRGPYFQRLALSEREVSSELEAVARFNLGQPGAAKDLGKGFPGFLQNVASWRVKTVRLLGGAFVKNSLVDYHSALISDFEKIAFIKLEMLGRAKERLLSKASVETGRGRGNVRPTRRDDQFYWSFNGEFWNDELGDYVFGLESECR